MFSVTLSVNIRFRECCPRILRGRLGDAHEVPARADNISAADAASSPVRCDKPGSQRALPI
jgi:hypothetical protein